MTRPALTLPLLLLLLAAPGASAASERCSARGAKVVKQNAQARVFYVKGKGEVKRRYYGCMRGRKPALLARDTSPRDIQNETAHANRQFQLSGPHVAWVAEAFSDFGAGEFGRSIDSWRLDGKRPSQQISQDVTDYSRVAALRVRADGALAWVLDTGGPYAEVDAIPSDSEQPVALAYAREIEAASLRFDTTSVHWTQGGAERSAEVR